MSPESPLTTLPEELIALSASFLNDVDLNSLQHSSKSGVLARIAASKLEDGHFIIHQNVDGKFSSIRPRDVRYGEASSESPVPYRPIQHITAISTTPRNASGGYEEGCESFDINRTLGKYLQSLRIDHSSTLRSQTIEIPLPTSDMRSHPEHIPGFGHLPAHLTTGAPVTSAIVERSTSGGNHFFTLFTPRGLDSELDTGTDRTHDTIIGHTGEGPSDSETFDEDFLYLAKMAANALFPLPGCENGGPCTVVNLLRSYDSTQAGALTEDALRAKFIHKVSEVGYNNIIAQKLDGSSLPYANRTPAYVAEFEQTILDRVLIAPSDDDYGAREYVGNVMASVSQARVDLGLHQE